MYRHSRIGPSFVNEYGKIGAMTRVDFLHKYVEEPEFGEDAGLTLIELKRFVENVTSKPTVDVFTPKQTSSTGSASSGTMPHATPATAHPVLQPPVVHEQAAVASGTPIQSDVETLATIASILPLMADQEIVELTTVHANDIVEMKSWAGNAVPPQEHCLLCSKWSSDDHLKSVQQMKAPWYKREEQLQWNRLNKVPSECGLELIIGLCDRALRETKDKVPAKAPQFPHGTGEGIWTWNNEDRTAASSSAFPLLAPRSTPVEHLPPMTAAIVYSPPPAIIPPIPDPDGPSSAGDIMEASIVEEPNGAGTQKTETEKQDIMEARVVRRRELEF